MCKYIIRGKGLNNSTSHENGSDDLNDALRMAEAHAIKHNMVAEVFERISTCTPKVGVSWEGKALPPPPARHAERSQAAQAAVEANDTPQTERKLSSAPVDIIERPY